MQQLESLMLECLAKMGHRGSPRGIGDGGEGEDVEDVGLEEWEEENLGVEGVLVEDV